MRRWGFRVEPPIGEVTDRACAVNGGTVCLRLPENPAADALHASDLSSTPTAAAPSSAGPAWRRPIDPDTGWQPALGPAAWQRTCVSSVLCGAVAVAQVSTAGAAPPPQVRRSAVAVAQACTAGAAERVPSNGRGRTVTRCDPILGAAAGARCGQCDQCGPVSWWCEASPQNHACGAEV